MLQRSQLALDGARQKLAGNQSLALLLVTDTQRYLADGLTRAERVQRFLALARGKQISGRWPMVASRQREDAEQTLEVAIGLLGQVELGLSQLRDRLASNPAVSEVMIADLSLLLARSLNRLERVVRLLIEAGIGRD